MINIVEYDTRVIEYHETRYEKQQILLRVRVEDVVAVCWGNPFPSEGKMVNGVELKLTHGHTVNIFDTITELQKIDEVVVR